jgi:hypothetical protein
MGAVLLQMDKATKKRFPLGKWLVSKASFSRDYWTREQSAHG